MGLPYLSQELDDLDIRIVKVHPTLPLAFLGTGNGDFIVFNIVEQAIIIREFFYETDEFNEPKKLETPICDISFSNDFEYVYAFTTFGAICFEISTLMKVASIPLEERLISGHVSQISGDIVILTEDGYVSRWTPKFHSRSGYFELNQTENLKKIRMINQDNALLIGERNTLFLLDFESHKVSKVLDFEKAHYLFVDNPIQANETHYVHLTKNGKVILGNLGKPKMEYFRINQSRDNERDVTIIPATEPPDVYKYLTDHFSELGKVEEKYHEDLRFARTSKDKYYAVSDHINEFQRIKKTLKQDWDPDLILHFAIKEFLQHKEKAAAMRIILSICYEYQIDPSLAIFAWKFNGRRQTNLIDTARRLQTEANKRQKKIRNAITISILLAMGLIIFGIYPLQLPYSLGVVLFGIGCNTILFYKVNQINRLPKIQFVETYFVLRFFLLLTTWISGFFILFREFGSFIIFFPS